MFHFTKGPYPAEEIESQIYRYWEDNHLFEPTDSSSGKTFSITMPPPNITGVLHLGHALDLTLPDIICRYKRLLGYDVCWFPGTDQAGLATNNKVEEMLKKQGIKKEDIGREQFIQKVWEWKDTYGSLIIEQMKLLGTSADWTKLRFTKDEEYEKAVVKAFVTYYQQGLIYRGKRMVQYCPRCKTALSDIEVEYKNTKGELVYISYPVEDSTESITIATTRVETMLGDSAIAVHPEDPRYLSFHGKFVILPLLSRRIPIITDDYVDREFGTGALKITPSHDPNDFELGKKHTLEFFPITDDGIHLNDQCGIYSGLTLVQAREQIKQDLTESGVLLKVEPYAHSVGFCERCQHILEPLISDQWYLKTQSLAEKGLKFVENGELEFIPSRWFKIYKDWMTGIYDWCISRQIWWGIRIPVWYCLSCGEVVVAENPPHQCPKCNSSELRQEEDVLDTWFGSALWPFACMGWPNNSEMFQKYFPSSLMVTGFDIIFFWVSRMIFSSLHFLDTIPFKAVYFHGLVLDKAGKKMSKSSSNAVDPTSLIKEHGADALRFTVTSYSSSSGQDIKFDVKKNKASRNFVNKIWNAGTFVIDNTRSISFQDPLTQPLSIWDCWIIDRYNHTRSSMQNAIEEYSFNEASQEMYSFFWHEFCDWYLESSKTNSHFLALRKLFAFSLQIMHPIVPFVTEALWMLLPENHEKSILQSSWPQEILLSEHQLYLARTLMPQIQEIIRVIRNVKSEFSLHQPEGLILQIYMQDALLQEELEMNKESIINLSRIENLAFVTSEVKHSIATPVSSSITIYFPKHLIDIEKEILNKQQRLEKVHEEITKLTQKLAQEDFMQHAPQELIEEVQSKHSEAVFTKAFLEKRIQDLKEN